MSHSWEWNVHVPYAIPEGGAGSEDGGIARPLGRLHGQGQRILD